MKRPLIVVVNIAAELLPAIYAELGDRFQLVVLEQHVYHENFDLKTKVSLVLMAPQLINNQFGLLLHEIKAHFKHLPIICIDKPFPPGQTVELFREGACDFVALPLKKGDLRSAINRVLLPSSKNTPVPLSIKGFSLIRYHDILTWLHPKVSIKKIMAVYKGMEHIYGLHRQTYPSSNTHSQAQKQINPVDSRPLPQSCDIEVRFLGNLHTKIKSKHISRLAKKPKMLLAYLLFHAPRRMAKDVLMEKFWPESNIEQARASLNVALYHIRKVFKALPHDIICYQNECYYINPKLELYKDVDEFLIHWRTARISEQNRGMASAVDEYHKALDLYKGDFIEEFPYESWISAEKEELQNKYQTILSKLIHYYLEIRDFTRSIQLGKQLIQDDPCMEEIHRTIMQAYLALNWRDQALKQFDKCKKVLQKEFGVPPSPETQALYEKIRGDYF